MFAWIGAALVFVAVVLHQTDATNKYIFALSWLGVVLYGIHLATGFTPWNRGNRGSIAGSRTG
jgi:hypothetical protein